MDWFQLTKLSVIENYTNKENFSILMTESDYQAILEIKEKYLSVYKEYHQDLAVLNTLFTVEVSKEYSKLTLESFTSWLCVFMLVEMNCCKIFKRDVNKNNCIVTFIWDTESTNLSTTTFMNIENCL